MSKVLLINGSPNEHGCTYTAMLILASGDKQKINEYYLTT